jgi:hypothetical protein
LSLDTDKQKSLWRRIMEVDPDSSAFHAARKKTSGGAAVGSGAGARTSAATAARAGTLRGR